MGLIVIGALGLYLLVSIGVVKWTIRSARRNGRSPWRWGGFAALVMYLIPFWDWLPTVVMHRYYCEKEAGFWVYKTVIQWQEENAANLTILTDVNNKRLHVGDNNNFVSTEFIGHGIKYEFQHNGPLKLNRWKLESRLVDTNTGEVIARNVNFSTSQYRRQAGLSGWKFWLDNGQCNSVGYRDAGSISTMIETIKGGTK